MNVMSTNNQRFKQWCQKNRERLIKESQAVNLREPLPIILSSRIKNVPLPKNATVITKMCTVPRKETKRINKEVFLLRNSIKETLEEYLKNKDVSAKMSVARSEDKLRTHTKCVTKLSSLKTSTVCLKRQLHKKSFGSQARYTNINVKRQIFNLGNITVNLITPYSDYQQYQNDNSKASASKTSNLFGDMFNNTKLSNLRNHLINSIEVNVNFSMLLLSETWLSDIPINVENYNCVVQFKHSKDKNKQIIVNRAEDSQAEIVSSHINLNFNCVDRATASSTDIGEISICESTTSNGKLVVVMVHIYKNQSASSIRNFLLHFLLPYTLSGAEMFETRSAESVSYKIPMILSGHFNVDFTSVDYSPLLEFLRQELSLRMAYKFPKSSIKEGLTIDCAIFARYSNLFESKITIVYLNRYHLQVLASQIKHKASSTKKQNRNHTDGLVKLQSITTKICDDNSHVDIQMNSELSEKEQIDIKIEPEEINEFNISGAIVESEIKIEPEEIDGQFITDEYFYKDNEIKIEPEIII